jgi:hypothetical protein
MVLLGELAALGASSYQLLRVTKAFMRINKKMHVRHEFAQMQVSQVIAAVYDGRELTAAQYLQTMTAHVAATGVHKVKLLESSQLANACAWAQPQIAKLALGYPDLYPYHAEYRVDPRISWYDGATVSLPSSNFHWRAVST